MNKVERSFLGFVAAHRASVHGRSIGKAATKQARMLELEFTLAPRPRDRLDGMRGGRRGSGRQRMRHDEEEPQGAVGGDCDDQHFDPAPMFRNAPNINTSCIEEFPTLGGEAPPVLGPPLRQNSRKVPANNSGLTIRTVHQSQPLAITDENFPALGLEGSTGGCKTVRLSVNSGSQDRPNSAAASSIRGSNQKAPTNVSIHVNHRPSGSSQNIHIRPTSVPSQFHSDFPSLSGSKVSTASSSVQWLGNHGSMGAKTKVQPQTQAPRAFKTEEDFPSLSSKFSTGCKVANTTSSSDAGSDDRFKKASSVMIPVTSSWTMTQGSSDVSRTHESSGEPSGIPGRSNYDILANTTSSLGNIKVKSRKKKTKNAVSHNANMYSNDSVLTKPAQSAVSESGKRKKKQGNREAEVQQNTQTNKNDCENRENEKPAEFGNGTDNSSTFERKRSELLIQSLTPQDATEDNNNELSTSFNDRVYEDMYPPFSSEILDDFHAIGSPGCWPPGLDVPVNRGKLSSAPPPGFGGTTNSCSTTAPPPGFSVTLNSVARPQSNGLTFTSSSGQSYSILPGRSGNSYKFVPPQDFSHRNQALVTRVKKMLGDAQSVDEFCQLSKMFRQGDISALDFYTHCQEKMGMKEFTEIFAELLVLLPDIEKQQVRLL